jgi:hypothetical protein
LCNQRPCTIFPDGLHEGVMRRCQRDAMLIRALVVLLLGTWPATALGRDLPPAPSDARVGLQCDATANRAFVRLGGADIGARNGFAMLPPDAPPSSAPIVDAEAERDVVCRLRDGREIRLRVVGPSGRAGKFCNVQFMLWVAARLVKDIWLGACSQPSSWDFWGFPQVRYLGWIVSPSRLEVCLRPALPIAGPEEQCRIAGDPRLMGESEADGRRLRPGPIQIAYAVDPRFCAALVVRGAQRDAPDGLAIQAVDRGGKPISAADGKGRAVLQWERATPEGSQPVEDRDHRFVVVSAPQLSGIRIKEDTVDGRTLCVFYRSDP